MAAAALGVWGWWSFDIFTLMATYLGPVDAGGQTIMRAIGLLTFMLPVGFSMGCSIKLGKSIGARKTNLAMTYYRAAQITSIVITVI